MDSLTLISSLCMGVGLAAASGMRIFLPLLLSGLVIRFGFFDVSPDVMAAQAWLGSNAALAAFGIATITEAAAYKIPYLDHLLDVLGAPAALVAGAILATSFLVGIDDPVLKYGLGIVAGAGSAGMLHGTSAIARTVSTKTTGGIANPVYSLGELVSSLVTTVVAFIAPILVATLVFAGLVASLFVLKRMFSGRKAMTPASK